MPGWLADSIGDGVLIRTPNSLPGSNGLVPTFNTDGTFAAWSAAGGITIGSTPITGGATTQVLYNSSGVVSSSANLVFSGTHLSCAGGFVLGSTSISPIQGQLIFYDSGGFPYVLMQNATTGTGSNNGSQFGVEGTSMDFYILQKENADIMYRTNNVERGRIKNTGTIAWTPPAGAIGITITGAASATVDMQQWNPNGVSAGTRAIITKEGYFSGLPTSDPGVTGALWNDAGTVKVS